MEFTTKSTFKTTLLGFAMAASLLVAGLASADTIDYVVQPGDTLSEIALNHNTTVDKLVKDNKIKDRHWIYVGQKLKVESDTVAAQAAPTATEEEYQAPAVVTETAQAAAPAPAQAAAPVQQAQTQTPAATTANTATGSDAAAKEEIARRESGGSYTARNGQYIGRYQLTASYLNGDYSAANQERVADAYVAQRYGSWSAALAFWNANGWY